MPERGSIVNITLTGFSLDTVTKFEVDSSVVADIECYVPGAISYFKEGKDPLIRDEFNPVTDPDEVQLLIQGKLQ